MRKLILFLSVVVAASMVLAKDIEFEPGYGPATSGSGIARYRDVEFEPILADAMALQEARRAAGEASLAAGAAELTPGEGYVIVARSIRTSDGRLVRIFEDASDPFVSNEFGDAFYGVESVERLLCRATAY